jgi:hypothetical protein
MPRLRSQHVIVRPVRLWMEEHIMANTPKNSALGLLEGRFGYTAVKTVSNGESRLCDEAKPGQILT